MKLKNEINQRKDILYLVIAIALTVLLAVYLFWHVRSLAKKANLVFSSAPAPVNVATFDFERYERIISNVVPSTSTLVLPPASPPAAPTSTSQ